MFGGKLARKIRFTSTAWDALQSPPKDVAQVVLRVNGEWRIGKTEFPGFFAANVEREWRSTYGDIEIDGYYAGPTGDDLTDAIWEANAADHFVSGYISRMKDFEGELHELRKIYFTPSPAIDHRLDLARAIYSRDVNEFFWSTIRSLRETEAWEQHKLEEKTAPYLDQFLIASIKKFKVTEDKLTGAMQRYGITTVAGSVVYVGQNANSFAQVYKELSESIIIPALKALPAKDDLQDRISKAITKQQTVQG